MTRTGPKLKPFTSVLDRLAVNEEGCWIWTGATTLGYGTVSYDGKSHRVHRLVFSRLVRPVPAGVELDHLCRNKACANPDHLEMVEHATNLGRAVMPEGPRGSAALNMAKTHCSRGHEYTQENIYWQGSRRSCRACRNSYRARRRTA